jgi:capsular polysaccharide biosynthesis protein
VQLLDTRLYQTTQINRLTRVPVLARIPNFPGSSS